MTSRLGLADILVETSEGAAGGKVRVGEVVEKVVGRGFRPIILIPALVALLPTRGLPNAPNGA